MSTHSLLVRGSINGKDPADMSAVELQHLYYQTRDQAFELIDALRAIGEGSIGRRPGHVDYDKNMTKAQIASCAWGAIAKATGSAT